MFCGTFDIDLLPTVCSLDEGLKDEMGLFGDIHSDDRDSVIGYSNMTVLSDVPEDYEPGRFHLVAQGVFVQLPKFRTIHFSGRLLHGGTAPLAPPGQAPIEWACRLVCISYPSGAWVHGTCRQALAALPQIKGDPLYLTPEMIGIW